MKLSKGDAVTYVALVLSAALQALEPWRKEASAPPDTHPILSSSVWAYIPLGLLVLVGCIWLYRQISPFFKDRTGSVAALHKEVAAPVAPDKKFASIEFRFKRDRPEVDPYILNAVVTASENMKNFVLIGTLARATHYVSGQRWEWETPVRLLKPNDLFKGEVREGQILFCWRSETSNTPINVFNGHQIAIAAEQFIMLRVTAICDASTTYLQRAYRLRRTGDVNTIDLIHGDEIAHISGANDGL
jgi:hypothetical protein